MHLSDKGNDRLSMWVGPSSLIRALTWETNTVWSPTVLLHVTVSAGGCASREQTALALSCIASAFPVIVTT